ncbi:unnamed protein product, partial [Candidula unifasciata]
LTTLDQADTLRRTAGHIQTGSGGQADARFVKNVATVISVESTATFEDKVTTRSELLRNVEKLDSRSKNSIEQVSSVLGATVEKANEIEPSGLEYGIRTACRLANYLERLSDDSSSVVNSVAAVQVNALSNLLNVAATHGEEISISNETDPLAKQNMTKQNIRQSTLATEALVNIANVLLKTISKVNDPIKVPTEFVDFIVAWNNVSKETSF